jgi:hypothetical protein
VALVALAVSLTGSAVALPGKNSVDANDIRRNAINSADVRNETLKGKDINEATLGTVPSVRTVETLMPIPRTTAGEGAIAATLATSGPFTLVLRCEATGGDT